MNKKTERIILCALGLLLFLIKHLLISNLPIEARTYQSDDQLMVTMAIAFRNGSWLGKYKAQLLMKGAFFPMFVGGINWLGLSYLGVLNFVNAVAALFFVYQLRHLLKKPVLRFILFAVLLFDPCSFSQKSFQRIYRTSITEMEVLFLWGAYYGIYGKSLKLKGRSILRELLLLFIAGGTLWAAWNTREECFWILPFVVTATLIIGFMYWKAGREGLCSKKSAVLRIVLLMMPFVMLFVGNQAIIFLNERYYGEAVRLEDVDGTFTKALQSMYSVKNEQNITHVTITQEKLERLCEVSPALRQILPELEAELERYDGSDRKRNDGEVEDGWFYWGLKYAAFKNGVADTLPKSQSYWNTVHQEIEAALNDPSSSLERQSVMPSALMSPLQDGYLESIPKTLQKVMKYLLTYDGMEVLAGSSKKGGASNDRLFESITNNVAVTAGEEGALAAAQKLPHLETAVKWLKAVTGVYHVVTPIAGVLGLISLIVLVFRLVFLKSGAYFPPVLVVCGMVLSMLIVVGGVCYTHISAFPAIEYNYLAGAYPLMLGSVWFSILYLLQQIQDGFRPQGAE